MGRSWVGAAHTLGCVTNHTGDDLPFSKSEVNRCGRSLAKLDFARLKSDGDYVDEMHQKLLIVQRFRAEHSTPLIKANNGLRSMARTEELSAKPTQRLKRVPSIIGKLWRQPGMKLARMQDIGGCRVVCANLDEVQRLARRLRKNRPPKHESDYISDPKETGYRGLHIVVIYDDRMIEVQLRTPLMHEWAVTQERIGARLGTDLKSGIAPVEILRYMRLASEAIAIEEAGGQVDGYMRDELGAAFEEAVPFLSQ